MTRMYQFTPVPNELFERYLKDLTLGEIKTLLVIIRQTLGYRKSKTDRSFKGTDWISISQFQDKSGYSNKTISQALTGLVQKQLIQILDRKGRILVDPHSRSGQRLYYRQLLRNTSVGFSSPSVDSAGQPVKKVHATKEINIRTTPTKGFRLKEYLEQLHESPYRPHNIIAYFFEAKGLRFTSSIQAEIAVDRHLPFAEKIQAFSDEKIVSAVSYLINVFPRFTVETIYKHLTSNN